MMQYAISLEVYFSFFLPHDASISTYTQCNFSFSLDQLMCIGGRIFSYSKNFLPSDLLRDLFKLIATDALCKYF